MTILLWVIFGMINGLAIHFFSGNKHESRILASIIGGLGGLSGGVSAYIVFGGESLQITPMSLVLLFLEGGLLYLLLSSKGFARKLE